ncbi:MAG: DNA polymerase I [Deltaproteobacteria bacterium]|nr:DNA polymerase I [Deltaproteobacteria bacterium]
MADTVYLIDGSGYIFRAYYALRRLSTSTGVPTNAVFNFATMLLRILKDHDPKYLGIAFDVGGKTFRHEMFDEYKAHRSAPPEDLPPQIPLIHRLVDTFRIPKLLVKGVEADDVLATMAARAKAAGFEVVIVTGDKDLMQLVDDHVTLLDEMRLSRGHEGTRIGPAQVLERFGVSPERVADVLALAGDASDNVPGVEGIGPKTATELVQQYGDVEAVLAHAHELKAAGRRDKLLAQADRARLSKQLVVVRRDVDVPVALDELRYAGIDKAAARAFIHELEFRRLESDPLLRDDSVATTTADAAAGAEAAAGAGAAAASSSRGKGNRKESASAKAGQGDLFGAPAAADEPAALAAVAAAPTTPIDLGRYRAVVDASSLADVVAVLRAAPRVALRTEVDRPGTAGARLVGLGVAWAPGEAAWLPVRELGLDALRTALASVLGDVDKALVAHDGKTDANALLSAGFPSWRLAGDPMLMSYLLDADAESHGLMNLSRRFLGHAMIDPADVTGAGKSAVAFDAVPLERAAAYVGEAVDCTLRVHDALLPRIEADGLLPLYRDLELPLEDLLGKMERAGVRIDIDRLKGLSDSFVDEIAALEQKAHAAAGRPFLLTSPQQVAELLFTELALPVIKRTKTGPSTDVHVLEALADRHDVPALILEHRTLTKLKNTYLDVLPQLVDAEQRVHTHYNQAVAATGRLSSSDPNLQNIPIRTPLGRRIRDAFVAKDGCVLVSLDYSQIELRILAHVSKDPVLVDTFLKNEDVHRRTAAEIFGVAADAVTRDQRTAAKSINFGLLYGMGVVRLARELGLKRAEAKEYLDRYFERLQGIRSWHAAALERAHVEREVRTLLGRRRKLPGLDSKNPGERARAERLAINTPIQGSAADIMKRAMIDADRALAQHVPSARILLQVHDELVIEVPEADAPRALEVGRAAMQGAVHLDVPLVVDGHFGRSWADAH